MAWQYQYIPRETERVPLIILQGPAVKESVMMTVAEHYEGLHFEPDTDCPVCDCGEPRIYDIDIFEWERME